MTNFAGFAVGVAFLVPATLLSVSLWRSPHNRGWVGMPMAAVHAFATLPMFSAAVFIAGVSLIVFQGSEFGDWLQSAAFIVFMVLVVLFTWFGLPRWWGPRWYRSLRAADKRAAGDV